MSFNWSSTSSSPSSLASMKPAASFADALKRLAEHVEERSRTIETNEHGTTANLRPPSVDIHSRLISSNENRTSSTEQALRLYNQYTHEIERREDLRRCYLRTYAGSDSSTLNVSTMNRRLDMVDPYRFMGPHLANLLPSPAHLQSLIQTSRLPLSSSTHFPPIKPNETASRSSMQEPIEKKSESTSPVSKSGAKLFRPYELDDPNLKPRRSSIKTTAPSPALSSTSATPSVEEARSIVPFGKEKQLLNSLGLVQQSTDAIAETSNASDESLSTDIVVIKPEDDSDRSKLSMKSHPTSTSSLKRKSIFPSHREKSPSRKQSRTDRLNKAT